jgi:CMP-N-acetylneuraminic acid synthetase
MIKKIIHKAIIPARAGSIGFPKKNQIFFENTANFLKNLSWIDEVIVTSDDDVVLSKGKQRKYTIYKRPQKLAGPDISIRQVLRDLIKSLNIKDDVILWLFYLPILFKKLTDFEKAKGIIEDSKVNSLCTFVPVKTHPLNTWNYDQKKNKIFQYIKNDIYRRQDLPNAWMHYHYICCFKSKEIKKLNNELLNTKTYPFFLSKEYSNNLIEIDSPEDLVKWNEANKNR